MENNLKFLFKFIISFYLYVYIRKRICCDFQLKFGMWS